MIDFDAVASCSTDFDTTFFADFDKIFLADFEVDTLDLADFVDDIGGDSEGDSEGEDDTLGERESETEEVADDLDPLILPTSVAAGIEVEDFRDVAGFTIVDEVLVSASRTICCEVLQSWIPILKLLRCRCFRPSNSIWVWGRSLRLTKRPIDEINQPTSFSAKKAFLTSLATLSAE